MPGRDRLWRPRTPSIADLLAAGDRPLFSFEFFPPKDEIQQRQLWKAVRELESLGPDFVSVTYGASGSTRERTIKATEAISQHTTLRAMAHLTCASQSRDQLRRVIGAYAAAGLHHVLAIRGDMPGGPRVPWEAHPEGLQNATELVAMVRELGDFCVGVAAFPDAHPERNDFDLDARVLAAKAQSGASFAITQLFFTADDYFALVARVRSRGCDIPIIPGIMPISLPRTGPALRERFTPTCIRCGVERDEPLGWAGESDIKGAYAARRFGHDVIRSDNQHTVVLEAFRLQRCHDCNPIGARQMGLL